MSSPLYFTQFHPRVISPKISMTRYIVATVVLLSFLMPQLAKAGEDVDKEKESSSVVVSGMRSPELKPYRIMLAGLDAFDKFHVFAPTASTLRFKLRPRSGVMAVDMENLTLRLAGDTNSTPLPLAEDHSFVLPRSEQAEDDNADLLLNKKKGDYRWQPMVQSEGVPASMRRLGDLRLECEVMIAIAKKEIGFLLNMTVSAFIGGTNWCGVKNLDMGTASTRTIKSAVLIDGEKRVALTVKDGGKSYLAPVGHEKYGDDLLIEFEFLDGDTRSAN